jgi:hypothetical protein
MHREIKSFQTPSIPMKNKKARLLIDIRGLEENIHG